MKYGKYVFSCRFTNSAELPHYKGSTFRGVFGIALKKLSCTLKNNECDSCFLNEHCIYAMVFETDKVIKVAPDSRVTSVPHPFVMEPPLTNKTSFEAGDYFEFNILLFGSINKKISYLIYALHEMGNIGIGKKTNRSNSDKLFFPTKNKVQNNTTGFHKNFRTTRGTFKLESVKIDKVTIYSTDKQKIIPVDPCKLNFIKGIKTRKILSVKLILETPLRIKFDNKLNTQLPFHILVRTLLRRLSNLLEHYEEGEPDIDYSALVKNAQNVKIIENNLKWFDWKRYSSRQNKKMLMGGITGSITYKGELEEYLPILEFCSRVHIGKQTVFGLGKFYFEVKTNIS